MAITLSTAARNAACAAVVALPDGGSPGLLKIKGGATVLATITLANPAFAAPSVGVATAKGGDGTTPISGANPLVDLSADASGTADSYDVTNSAGTVQWSGSVTLTGGGGDLLLDNLSINAAQQVKITGWTHNQPA